MPAVATELRAVLAQLEGEFGDMQDVEFTIEQGKLWLLQTRTAKRTPRAALRIAVDFVREGRISKEEALRRLSGLDLTGLAVTRFVEGSEPTLLGIGASGGVAVGTRSSIPRQRNGSRRTVIPSSWSAPIPPRQTLPGFAQPRESLPLPGG